MNMNMDFKDLTPKHGFFIAAILTSIAALLGWYAMAFVGICWAMIFVFMIIYKDSEF